MEVLDGSISRTSLTLMPAVLRAPIPSFQLSRAAASCAGGPAAGALESAI